MFLARAQEVPHHADAAIFAIEETGRGLVEAHLLVGLQGSGALRTAGLVVMHLQSAVSRQVHAIHEAAQVMAGARFHRHVKGLLH